MDIIAAPSTPDVFTDTVVEATDGEDTTTLILFISIAKIIIGVVGLIGNSVVLLVLRKLESLKMKFLVGSQAAIDALTSVVLIAGAFTNVLNPVSVPSNATIGVIFCWLWRQELVMFALFALSSYNLLALSIERYIAVLHPLYYRSHFTRNNEIMLGIVAWLVAPIAQVLFVVTRFTWLDGACVFLYTQTPDWKGVFIFLWDFLIPCLVMGYCFTRISLRLFWQDKEAHRLKDRPFKNVATISGNETDSEKNGTPKQPNAHTSNRFKRSREVTKTFIAFFVVYILCWVTNQS